MNNIKVHELLSKSPQIPLRLKSKEEYMNNRFYLNTIFVWYTIFLSLKQL